MTLTPGHRKPRLMTMRQVEGGTPEVDPRGMGTMRNSRGNFVEHSGLCGGCGGLAGWVAAKI
jgi:hypothetical protein